MTSQGSNIYPYLTIVNIFYLDMPKIYHITLINIGTHLTILGVVLNEFVHFTISNYP